MSKPKKQDTFTVKYEEITEDISENNSIRLSKHEEEPKRGNEHIIFFETSCSLD